MISYKSLHSEFQGYIGPKPTRELQQFMIEDDRVHEIRTVTVHEFSVGDAEDPDLYASVPLLEWQSSEKGTWVMEHAAETPMWHRMIDPASFSWRYCITARLKGADYTFYVLRWGQSI